MKRMVPYDSNISAGMTALLLLKMEQSTASSLSPSVRYPSALEVMPNSLAASVSVASTWIAFSFGSANLRMTLIASERYMTMNFSANQLIMTSVSSLAKIFLKPFVRNSSVSERLLSAISFVLGVILFMLLLVR